MAMDTSFATIKEVQWLPEECPLVEAVSVASEQDSLCSQILFRSRRVKPFPEGFKIKAGPTKASRGQSGKDVFLQLLDRNVIQVLCKSVNTQAAEVGPEISEGKNKRRAVQHAEFLAFVAVPLRGGVFTGIRDNRVHDAIAFVEIWLDRFPRSRFQDILQHLSGKQENEEEQWKTFYSLQGKISRNFQVSYLPGQKLCVKKYTLSHGGQPARPDLRIALLCDVQSGYVCNFCLYSPARLLQNPKCPTVVQVLHQLLKPYYNKGYQVQLDSSACMEGRLSKRFSDHGIQLNFTCFWAGEETPVRTFSLSGSQQQRACDTPEDAPTQLNSHLGGWMGPVVFPLSTRTLQSPSAVVLAGFWLTVHLSCINAFVLSVLQLQESNSKTCLHEFTTSLATMLAIEHFMSSPLLPVSLSSSPIEPHNKQSTAISDEGQSWNNRSSPEKGPEEAGCNRGTGMGPGPGLSGLLNSGNSCYLSAVLHCLSNTTPLLEYFLDERNRSAICKQKRTLAGALVRFLSEMWFGGQETLAPTEMRSVISDLHPQFDSRSQQDAQELLLYLLNGLHEDLKNKAERRSLSSFLLKRENGGASATPESSIITLLFEGQLRYVTQGLHCDHQTQSSQVFTMLSLPIPNGSKKCSLQDCLALFFQQNTLTSSNQILCSQCGIKQDTAILTTLDSPPTILILHLKRFECQGKKKKKLKTNVSFSMENLDLSPYVSPSSSKHKTYWLYAVINHSGDLNAGHYTACCRNPLTQRWHNYDDATVSEIPDYLIQSSSAYILLYSCQEIRKPCVPGL